MRKFIPFIVLLSILAPRAKAQWRLLHTFDHQPRVIYFLDDVGEPQTGFVGCNNNDLWRTTDAGKSWTQCIIPPSYGLVTCIAFKDALKGWVGLYGAPPLETTDGGLSWTALSRFSNSQDISYRASTNLLILTQWSDISLSSDEGQTWTDISQHSANGITFATDMNGIISDPDYQPSGELLATNDGGMTWATATRPDGAWLTAAIPGSNTYYLTSEYSSEFFVSTDGAQTWSYLFTFPDPQPNNVLLGLSGCTRYSTCGKIYVQSVYNGVYQSADSGQSWQNIGGPNAASQDLSFAVLNGSVYASDVNYNLYEYTIEPSSPFLRFADGGKQAKMNIPDTISAWLSLSGAVPSGAALDSINATMTFDGDAISPVYVNGLEGFQVEQWKQNGNMLNFTLVRSVRDALLADSAVAQIGFQSFVSRNSYSPIQLTQVALDNDSLLTDNCSFAIASAQDSLLVNLNPACPDSILRIALDGKFLVSDFSIVPNPAENHASAYISLSGDASVTIEVTDALGRKCGEPIEQTLFAGEHSININLPNESGIYFLSLEATSGAELVRQTRTVVVLQ